MRGLNRTSHEAVTLACISLAIWIASAALLFPLMRLDEITNMELGTIGGIIMILVLPPVAALSALGALILACISTHRKEPHGPMALCFASAGVIVSGLAILFLLIV